VDDATPAMVRSVARDLRGGDLLVALARPNGQTHLLPMGITGPGFHGGELTSDSTRTDGLVTSTDLAPTILARFGIPVPSAINGQAIRATGTANVADLESFANRLGAIGSRRGPVLGVAAVAWLLATLAGLAVGGFWRRRAPAVLALTAVYAPAMLLVTAAIEPSLWGERLIVMLLTPAVAVATLAVLGGWTALAVACALTVCAYAADVIAGSHLVVRSLGGPNPASGSRFFGIGNELEAAFAVVVPLGVGAALASRPRLAEGGRRAAGVFLAVGFLAAAVFALGRFGADVGAAIVLPAGAAVAAAVSIGSRGWVALVLIAPVVAVAALVAADLALGGGAHLTRSVLDAGGFNSLGDTFERRIRLAGHSFTHAANLPYLAVILLLAGLAWTRRRQLWTLLGVRAYRAAVAGGASAAVLGAIANDSGAILLIVGAFYLVAGVAYAWSHNAENAWQPASTHGNL
jgi:hypothetical protein